MGQAIAKCMGWETLLEERELRKQEGQQKKEESQFQQQMRSYEKMQEYATKIETIYSEQLKNANVRLTAADQGVEQLRQQVGTAQPSAQQLANMAMVLTTRQLAQQERDGAITELIKQRQFTAALQNLAKKMEVKEAEKALMRAGSNVLNDKADDGVEEHQEEGGEFASRIRELMSKFTPTLSADVEAPPVTDTDATQAIMQQAAAQFSEFRLAKETRGLPTPATTARLPASASATTTVADIQATTKLADILLCPQGKGSSAAATAAATAGAKRLPTTHPPAHVQRRAAQRYTALPVAIDDELA